MGPVSGPTANESQRRPARVPSRNELPPLIPRPALAVIDEAITFLRVDPGLLFGVTLIVLLPLRFISAAMPGSQLRDARPDELMDVVIGNASSFGTDFAPFATLILESVALFTVASVFAHIATIWYAGNPATLSDVLVQSIKRSPFLAIGWIFVHVLEALSSVLTLGLGGLVIAVFVTLTAPIMGAEQAGPIRAIRRSFSLMSGTWFHGAIVFVCAGLGALVMRLAIEFAPSVIGLELLQLPLWAVAGVADLIASIVVTALVAAVSTVHYLDARVRREGIDLDMAAALAFDDSRMARRR